MKKLIYSVAACSLLLCSCSDNDAIEEAVNNSHAIIASIEGTPETKLVITDNADATTGNKASTFVWGPEESIWVSSDFAKKESAIFKNGTGADGKKTFTNSTCTFTPAYAIYYNIDIAKPQINLTGSDTKPEIHLVLPGQYDLTTNKIYPPMFANISGNKADFKHLAGMLRINISKIPTNKNVSYSLKVSSTTHQLVGEFKIMNLSETQKLHKIIPAIKLADVPDNNTITIYNVPNRTNIYIPLPTIVEPKTEQSQQTTKTATDFSNLTFTVTKKTTDASNNVTTETKTKTIKNITVARANLYTLNLDYSKMASAQ